MSELQGMLTTNGVLLSVTADVKTTTRVPTTRRPWPNLCPFLLSHRLQTLPLGNCFYGGTRSSGAFTEICFERDKGGCSASLRRISHLSSGAHII